MNESGDYVVTINVVGKQPNQDISYVATRTVKVRDTLPPVINIPSVVGTLGTVNETEIEHLFAFPNLHYKIKINHIDIHPDGSGQIVFKYNDNTNDTFRFTGNGGLKFWDFSNSAWSATTIPAGTYDTAGLNANITTNKNYTIRCLSDSGYNTWEWELLDAGLSSSVIVKESSSWGGIKDITISNFENVDLSNGVLKLNYTDVSNSTLLEYLPHVTAFDKADGDCSVNVLVTLDGSSTLLTPADVSLNVFGKTYKIVYDSSDNVGKLATSELKIMLTDTESPTLELAGADAEIEARLTPAFSESTDLLPWVIRDNIDASADISLTIISGSVDVTTPGTYTLEYQAEDSCGNKATATRTVTVVDTTGPDIFLVNNNLTYAKYINEFNYLEEGGSAVDIVVPNILLDISVVEMSGNDQIPLTADASNSAYYPDLWRVPPTITDGVIVNNGKGKPGHYKVKYNATDGSNDAIEIVRNIYILRDVESPTIEISGMTIVEPIYDGSGDISTYSDSSGIQIEAGTVTSTASFVAGASSNPRSGYYTSDYLTINDSNWADICLNITTNLSVNDASFSLVGFFTETITVSDPDDNSANIIRTIQIVDTVGPSFTLSGPGLDANNRLVLQSSIEAGNKFSDISTIVQATDTSDVDRWVTIPDTTVTSTLVGEQNIYVYAVDVNDISSATQRRYALFI